MPNKLNKVHPLRLKRKIALLSAGYTGADVARAAGVSRQTVSLVLSDRAKSANVEQTVARLTGVPREKLFPAA